MRSSLLLVLGALAACESIPSPAPDLAMPVGPCGAVTAAFRFPDGSVDGHADPAGARAAKQARAGRITSPAMIRLPADALFPVRVGDYLIANDKVAVYIEAARPSDGYNPFGGELAAIDTVGDDGLPRGLSEWSEGIFAAGGMVVAPERVTVLADGSDGGPAIVRSQGMLKAAPFLEGYAFLFGKRKELPAALDYVLAPGADHVTVRMSIQNTDAEPIDLSAGQLMAFFMNRADSFSPGRGFTLLDGNTPWLGWETGQGAVGARGIPGGKFDYTAAVEGAQIFSSSGAKMDACASVAFDYVQVFAAYPGIDALGEVMRSVGGEPAWRAISGTVKDASGQPIVGAQVHATQGDVYLSRVRTAADGSFLIHAPAEDVSLSVTDRGLAPPTPTVVSATTSEVMLVAGALGRITVAATEQGSGRALPARVQIFPSAPQPELPESFGVNAAGQGRAHLVFGVDGKADVSVAEGSYRVVVSRGYEYELFDQMVTVTAGQTTALAPVLARSVSTPGTLSADFHIHSFCSLDSADPVEYKVRGALAEGVELPVSSEHEYIVDFEPVVEQLGATAWARGFASEELSTATFGHFGVVPLVVKPEAPNRGVAIWAGQKPPGIFDTVRKLDGDPALIVNHPMSTQAFKGYFVDANFDVTTASGDPTTWSTNWDAIEVFNDSDFEGNREKSVAAWFSLIRHGKVVWATGSSDNHKLTSNPVGYPRTFLALGTDDPQQVTPTQLRDAIRSGHSVIGGGLYMTVSGPGGVGPGGTLSGPGPHSFDIVVQSPGWLEAKTLEVLVDGETAQTIDLVPSVTPGPGHRYEATVDVSATNGVGPHFVVFHASSPGVDLAPVHPGKRPFVVSNPVFFD